MKPKLLLALSLIILFIFTGAGIKNVVLTKQDIKLQEIEIQSKDAKLKSLQLKLQTINIDLDKALSDSKTDRQTIEKLDQERQKIEQEKKDLEQQLALKREQQKLDQERENKVATALANTVTLTNTASAQSGDKNSLMAAAGIPSNDWGGMDRIISGEGGWDGVTRWNTGGSGAYGLCQSLPAGKMASAGTDWATNPITQLKWCYGYALAYGSVAQAVNFKFCLGSCYSGRTNTTEYKVEHWF